MSLVDTLKLRALGFLKIPMIFFVSPTVVEINDRRCVIKVPLTRRTKNHWGSMYFGALSVGADCAGGLMAWRLGDQRHKGKVSLIFKDFRAEFLKRPEGDTYFTCEDGEAIQVAIQETMQSGERKNIPVHITATVPSKLGEEPVARFVLTLSLKSK